MSTPEQPRANPFGPAPGQLVIEAMEAQLAPQVGRPTLATLPVLRPFEAISLPALPGTTRLPAQRLRPGESQQYLERILAGDPLARNELVERRLVMAHRLASSLHQRLQLPELALDDLFQIAIEGLYNSVARLRPGVDLRQFLALGTMLHLANATRSTLRQSQPAHRLHDFKQTADRTSTLPDDQLETMMTVNQQARLRQHLRELLNQNEQRVLALRFGFPPAAEPLGRPEIARQLGLTRQGAWEAERRGLAKLQKLYTGL